MLNSKKLQQKNTVVPVDHIFDLIPFPLFIIDLCGTILMGNLTAEELFYKSKEGLKGKHCQKLFSQISEKELNQFLNAFKEKPTGHAAKDVWELTCQDKNGKTFLTRLQIAFLTDSKDRALLSLLPPKGIASLSN